MNVTTSKAAGWERLWLRLAPVLLAAGLAAMTLVILAAIKGEPFAIDHILYVKPSRYLALAAFFLAAAWLAWNAGRPAGSVKRAAAQLLMLGFSLALSIAVAETGLRAILKKKLDAGSFEQFKEMKRRGQQIKIKSETPLAAIVTPSDNPALVYELQRGLDMEFGHHRLRINADGMRKDREVPRERLPRSVRILGLGDSGMFGWGVEQGRSYLDVLETTLNARGDGVTYETLNTGTPGYNTQLEVALCRERGLAWKPDIVVVGWCNNDFFLPEFFFRQRELPKDRLLLADLIFNRPLYHSELAGPSIGDRNTARGADGKVDLSQVPEELKAGLFEPGVARSLAELKELGARNGFHVLVFGPMKADILKIVRELGIDYCSTLEKIPADKYPADWHVHAMHPREEGHRVLGELLAQELAARGWLSPK